MRLSSGDRYTLYEVARKPVRGILSIVNAFRGHIDGLTKETIADALRRIQTDKVDTIFVDGSNFGALVKQVKTKLHGVEVVTFIHNVEAHFFFGALTHSRSFRALGVLLVHYFAEAKSVKYSDKRICLSERDSKLLRRLYGRSATHISPMALEDKLPPVDASRIETCAEKFALFVGGLFYANRSGIS
jgi:polysaccharide biosynthesis protein PslH